MFSFSEQDMEAVAKTNSDWLVSAAGVRAAGYVLLGATAHQLKPHILILCIVAHVSYMYICNYVGLLG